MKFAIIVITILFPLLIFCQKDRRDYLHEIRITSENDNYAFSFMDGYYTNGLFIQYSKAIAPKTQSRKLKVVSDVQVGQMIFVSQKYTNRSVSTIDRPYSGYLFLQKGYKYFYHKGNVFHWAVSVGATGNKSLAKEVQTWYHKVTGLPSVKGWPLQLNGEMSLNFSLQYDYNLFADKNPKRIFDLRPTISANLGNAFTNTTAGIMARFGNFERAENSSFYQARTGNGTGKKLARNAEVFVYFYPQYRHQFYNATVQGPMFTSYKGPITSGIVENLYLHTWGIHYAQRRWTMDLHFTYKNKEAKTMRENEKFGSLSIGYRFARIRQNKEPGFAPGFKN